MFKRKPKLSLLVDTTPAEREDFYAQYGQLMRKIRQEMNLTLSDLSKQLQIPEQNLSDYESGAPVPFIEGVAIYQYLGIHKKRMME